MIAADAVSKNPQFQEVYRSEGFSDFETRYDLNFQEMAGVVLTRYFLTVLQGVEQFIPTQSGWSDFDRKSDPMVVQIAVPTGLLDPESDRGINDLFRQALKAAMYLSKRERISGRFPIDRIIDAWRAIEALPPEEMKFLDDRCLTYPEVAGGVQTIFRSRSMPAGKYITMDVGAGTVDLNVFYRGDPDADYETNTKGQLHYWACEVGPYGAAHLGRSGAPAHEQTFHSLAKEELFKNLDKLIGDLMDEAMRRQPSKIKGNAGSPWQRDTFVYAWGGGIGHPEYERSMVEALQRFDIPVETPNRLPVPTDDFSVPTDVGQFGRLAVAYGLSYHCANLEKVKLPHEIRTFSELYPDYWSQFELDREWCSCPGNPNCPKCHGTGFIDRKAPGTTANAAAIRKAEEKRKALTADPVVKRQPTPHEKFEKFRNDFERKRGEPPPPLVQQLTDLRRLAKFAEERAVNDDAEVSLAIHRFQKQYSSIRGEVWAVPHTARVASVGISALCRSRGKEKILIFAAENPDGLVALINCASRSKVVHPVRLSCECRRLDSGKYQLRYLSPASRKKKRPPGRKR